MLGYVHLWVYTRLHTLGIPLPPPVLPHCPTRRCSTGPVTALERTVAELTISERQVSDLPLYLPLPAPCSRFTVGQFFTFRRPGTGCVRGCGSCGADIMPPSNHPFHCWTLLFLSRSSLFIGLYPRDVRVPPMLDYSQKDEKRWLFRVRDIPGLYLVLPCFSF